MILRWCVSMNKMVVRRATWWLGWGMATGPALAWAQASGELPDMGPGAARSGVWQAVQAAAHQRDSAVVAAERRLSVEQRQQLREQVRRTAAWAEDPPPRAQRTPRPRAR
ncbi:hypothetical protein [Ottowia sp.]|uniref:hypothetical protein n=1 Tax=Ottowia sp. TaxID=1898956 RepID=UPI002C6A859B|nr:hypothetical protein [Ottowia sp.]HOB66644.1 hypothetical protein [Ottowia sp.]HPZ56982.1 hypothetical protein [Ottowia sp.]HQD47457.1 hypothetical protein [Ottowia sp.]